MPPLDPLSTNRGQISRCQNTRDHDEPTSPLDRLVAQCGTGVPYQMSDTVEAVICGKPSERKLERELGNRAHRSNRGDHRCRVEVPAEQGRDEVAETEEVETAGQDRACDTVQRGANPGDLWLVDGEMRSDWSVETLLNELL